MRHEIPFSAGYQSNIKIIYILVCVLAFFLGGLGCAGVFVALSKSSGGLKWFLLVNSGLLLIFFIWLARFIVKGFSSLSNQPALILDQQGLLFLPVLNAKHLYIPWRDIESIYVENSRLYITPLAKEFLKSPPSISNFLKPFYKGKAITLPQLSALSNEDLAVLMNTVRSGYNAPRPQKSLTLIFPNRYYIKMNYRYNLGMLLIVPLLVGGLALSQALHHQMIMNAAMAVCLALYIALRVFIARVDQKAPSQIRLKPNAIEIETVKSRGRSRRTYQTRTIDKKNIDAVSFDKNEMALKMKEGGAIVSTNLHLAPDECRIIEEAINHD